MAHDNSNTAESTAIGRKRWVIADGYIPAWSNGPGPELTSHEAVCILNASTQPADVRLTIFFSDREPAGPYQLTVPARRTLHARLNELEDPEPIPSGKGYSCLIESNVAIVAQHTRLDSRHTSNALISTIAWAE